MSVGTAQRGAQRGVQHAGQRSTPRLARRRWLMSTPAWRREQAARERQGRAGRLRAPRAHTLGPWAAQAAHGGMRLRTAHLGLEKELGARHAARRDGLAHLRGMRPWESRHVTMRAYDLISAAPSSPSSPSPPPPYELQARCPSPVPPPASASACPTLKREDAPRRCVCVHDWLKSCGAEKGRSFETSACVCLSVWWM